MTRRSARSTSLTSSRDVDRFWSHVDKTDTCWLWTGATNGVGYGLFRIGSTVDNTRRQVLVHRVSFTLAHGHEPVGTIDHLCRVRHCVNPDHLEDVTLRENLLRGTGTSARHARKTCCPKCGGTYTVQPNGARGCTPCRKAYNREWQRKRKR